MRLFGWHEQSEAAFGIELEIRDSGCFVDTDFDSKTGELCICHAEHPGEDGYWFRTLRQVKVAAIALLMAEISWRKKAVAKIRGTRKKAVI